MSTIKEICSQKAMDHVQVVDSNKIVHFEMIDLSGDGKAEEGFAVKESLSVICGDIPDEEIVGQITDRFGLYDTKSKPNGVTTLVGSLWDAKIDRKDNATSVTIRVATPQTGSMTLKHLDNKVLKMHDPVSINDGKVYFVVFFDFKDAASYDLKDVASYDGKKMSIDYSSVKLKLVTKEQFLNLQRGMDPAQMSMKTVKLTDVASVMSHGAQPDAYVNR